MNEPLDRLESAIARRHDPVLIDIYNQVVDQFDRLTAYASELELQQFALAARKSRIIRSVNNSNRLIMSAKKQLDG